MGTTASADFAEVRSFTLEEKRIVLHFNVPKLPFSSFPDELYICNNKKELRRAAKHLKKGMLLSFSYNKKTSIIDGVVTVNYEPKVHEKDEYTRLLN